MTNIADNIFTKWGGRRFLIAVVCIILASFLCTIKLLSGSEWVAAVVAILGFYNAANSYQKKVEADHDRDSQKDS